MSMGKGPGGGGLNMPAYNPQPSYQPYQPWQPPSMSRSYNPMMDMYGSMTQVMQPMPNYYQQFPVPGGYNSRPYQPPPVMQPQPQPQPQPTLPGGGLNQNYPNFGNPFAGIPFDFSFNFGGYNGQPVTDEMTNSGPPPDTLQYIPVPTTPPPPPNYYGGINPGGMYTPATYDDSDRTQITDAQIDNLFGSRGGLFTQQADPAAEISSMFGNVAPITAGSLGVPANTSASGVSNARPQSDLAGTVGTSTTPMQLPARNTPMPILDGFRPVTKEQLQQPSTPAPTPAPLPDFGGYTNNVRLAGLPFMGGFNIGGIF